MFIIIRVPDCRSINGFIPFSSLRCLRALTFGKRLSVTNMSMHTQYYNTALLNSVISPCTGGRSSSTSFRSSIMNRGKKKPRVFFFGDAERFRVPRSAFRALFRKRGTRPPLFRVCPPPTACHRLGTRDGRRGTGAGLVFSLLPQKRSRHRK
jgi:hypothetical protein